MERLFQRLASPDGRVVLRVGATTLTDEALARRCAGVTASLEAHGARPGDAVGVWTQPSLDTLVALVACAAGGYVTVPLDTKLGPMELAHIAKDAKPSLTLSADAESVAGRIEGVRVLPVPGEACAPASVGRRVDDEPLLILYTSGTTGLPKGAVLSARNVAFDVDALAKAWAWSKADTVVHALPMFHVHGLVLGLYGSLRNGAGLRWLPRFEVAEVARALDETPGETLFFAVPTIYHRLVDAAASQPEVVAALKKPRLLVSGSAALPLREHQRIEALTGRRVVERYGLTETLINTAVRAGSVDEAGRVGRALDGVELRLVDDARRPLEARDDETLGEVAVRGPNVFVGYLNRPDATAAVKDADGWFYSGDLATQRADGSVRIVGRRATDLIKCGGFKVGAGEVEAALLEHPQVAEAAVVGRPDADLGERIVAFVVPRAPVEPQALADFVAGLLSPHKRPREVRLLEALPRNAMGKVQKRRLP